MRTRYVVPASVFLAVLASAGPVAPANAQAGGGLVTTNIATASDRAEAVAVQPDGKIVVAGGNGADFALVRYNRNGTLDTGFGTGGTVTTRISGLPLPRSLANAIVIQPDGRIVAAGQTSSSVMVGRVVLVRYNPDGSLDSGFGTGGIVRTSSFRGVRGNPIYAANAVALRDDGRITIVGTGGFADFIAARYNPDGSLDPGFGDGGTVLTRFGDRLSQGHALVLRDDGRIVAAGEANPDFGLARYNPNGTLDPTFGTGGLVTTDFAGGLDHGRAAFGRPDGRIVVAGFATTPRPDVELAAYNPDGSLDAGFGRGGKVTTDFANTQDEAHGAALQADGKIVIAGRAGNDFAVARYNLNGTLDTTFGLGGKATTDFAGAADSAAAVTIQPDGRILVAGQAANAGTGGDFALARYNPNGTLDTTFGG